MQSDPINHVFSDGSRFKDVIERYEFDNALRKILFTAIDTIEIALRTKLIYHMSQAHGGLWYMDSSLFNNANLHARQLQRLQVEFAESGEVFAKEYRRQHPNQIQNGWLSDEDPDAWIILEVATLGDLSKLYKNIGHQLPAKSKIANDFGLSIHSDLASWLEAIAYIRNIVAHHSRLWSRNMVKRPAEPHNPQNTWLSSKLSDMEAKRPFYIITAMLYLCDAVNSSNRLREEIFQLMEKYRHLPIQRMGFFTGWEKEPIWATKKERKLGLGE
jgi:abortive infection bacteriophage resistance protein